MKIGIDISQIVYEGSGVATYVRRLVSALLQQDPLIHEYILFGASLRRISVLRKFAKQFSRARLVVVPIPPTVLEILWNTWHILPVEWITGPLDVFISSDWTQPPVKKAISVTTIHDLSPLLYPQQTAASIVATHTRRLAWVARECQAILCDSHATKHDVIVHLGVPAYRVHVVYPGVQGVQE